MLKSIKILYSINFFINIKNLTTVRGFTLIEIMVAILIIGSSYIGLLQSFPFSLSIIKTAENETIASYLAQEKLEDINQLDYTSIATGTIEVKHILGATGTPLHAFERQTEVDYVDINIQDSATDQGLKKITTTVYFTNSINKTEDAYSIYALIADR